MAVNLFDANYYRAANADLANFNDQQAASHFQTYGLNEGRAFSPLVNLNVYRSSNSDLASFNNKQAFDHLQQYGVAEGRRFSEFADLNIYRASNSDLASFNNEQVFGHLQNYGIAEGRRFSQLYDVNFYRNANGDLGGLNNRQVFNHLQQYGINEGRRFSQFVDLNLYKAANNDLSAAGLNNRQLLNHLASYGVAEGRRFSVSFDSGFYRNTHSDLAAAKLNNTQLLEHFERYGLNEGRASSESFNVSYYLANNPDLKAAKFSFSQAQQHFELYGFQEGRKGAPSGNSSVPTDPGTTLGSATNLGILNGDRNVTQSVGGSDPDDYYRFTLARTSNLKLSLSGLTSDANIKLIYDSNANGQVDNSDNLREANGTLNANASITSALAAGSYFVRVNANTQADTNYNLSLSATPTSPTTPRDPGNTLNAALDIGVVSDKREFKDFIGSADREDYYRFNLTTTSNFNLSLNDLADNANVQLIYDHNKNGQIDDTDILKRQLSQSNDVSISSALGAGSYFIRVNIPYGSVNTNYTLGVSATPTSPTTPSDPGNSLSTSLDIGSLRTVSYNDFVGSVDRNDYYRFTLTNSSRFNLSLDNLKDSATVELISDKNGNGQYDFAPGTPGDERLNVTSGNQFTSGSIITNLNAGTYFIRVNSAPNNNTNYTLSLSA